MYLRLNIVLGFKGFRIVIEKKDNKLLLDGKPIWDVMCL